MGAAGRVEHDDVEAAEPAASMARRAICTGSGRRRWEGSRRRSACRGRRAAPSPRGRGCRGGHQHLLLLLVEESAWRSWRWWWSCPTLQADHQDRHRRHGLEVDGDALGAERVDERVVDDLHDHLAGGHRLDDSAADGAVPHLVGEGAHDLERDIRLRAGRGAPRASPPGRSASLSAPRPLRRSRMPDSRVDRPSNMIAPTSISGGPRKMVPAPRTATHISRPRAHPALSGGSLRGLAPVGGLGLGMNESAVAIERQARKVKECGRWRHAHGMPLEPQRHHQRIESGADTRHVPQVLVHDHEGLAAASDSFGSTGRRPRRSPIGTWQAPMPDAAGARAASWARVIVGAQARRSRAFRGRAPRSRGAGDRAGRPR